MTRYLLDTNHLSPLVTLDHPLRVRILEALSKGSSFAICVPVLTEFLFGISILPRVIYNRAEWKRLHPYFPCYLLDEIDAERAADLQLALRRQGRQLATIDALISTIALRYDLVLLTKDKDFAVIPTLIQENWLVP